MDQFVVNGVGVAAALCSMGSFLPQVIKIWRERDASSVSLHMYVVTVTGFALWSIYGLMLGSLPLIGSNLVSLGLAATVLVLRLRFGPHEKGRGTDAPRPLPSD
jgi:MtN3 and saliva related transmembrane protein